LRHVESFAEALFGFADKFVVEGAGIEAGEFEAPFAGDGASGEAFAATLHAGDENSLGRNEAEALAFGSERTFALVDPVAEMSEAGDVSEGSVAADGFEQAIAAEQFPFGFEDGVEESCAGAALFERAHAESAHGFGERQAGEIGRKFLQRSGIESRNDAAFAAEVGESLFDAGEQFVGAGKAEVE